MTLHTFLLLLFVLLSVSSLCSSSKYHPVVLMHGLDGHPERYELLSQRIAASHNGTQVHVAQNDPRLYSVFKSIPQQVLDLKAELEQVTKKWFDEGHLTKEQNQINLVCHSQGGIVCRTFIETFGDKMDFKVHRFVSMAGVQSGVFGITRVLEERFPFLKNWTRDDLHDIFYHPLAQEHFALANYWRDTLHYEDYMGLNAFLPLVNNEVFHEDAERFKKNFASLDLLVLCGSSGDELVEPPSSSIFSPFKVGSAEELVPMHDTEWYTKDLFGLRTLDEANRVHVHYVPGVLHLEWLSRMDLFESFILPSLD